MSNKMVNVGDVVKVKPNLGDAAFYKLLFEGNDWLNCNLSGKVVDYYDNTLFNTPDEVVVHFTHESGTEEVVFCWPEWVEVL